MVVGWGGGGGGGGGWEVNIMIALASLKPINFQSKPKPSPP